MFVNVAYQPRLQQYPNSRARPYITPLHTHSMFGFVRRKKTTADSGLLYAGSSTPKTPRPADTGDIQHTYNTTKGTVEMRNDAMILTSSDGSITIPYHQIDAWDDTGKRLRVWWYTGSRRYTAACIPEVSPTIISEQMRHIIHQNTFE